MKALKIVGIAVLVYLGIVVAFESLIGILQPTPAETIVLTTFEPNGSARDRVVTRLSSEGRLYVAANHWPRAWYDRALSNPEVEVTQDGERGLYRAVSVVGEEHARIGREHPLPLVFRFLTGFPPRVFVRLDPR